MQGAGFVAGVIALTLFAALALAPEPSGASVSNVASDAVEAFATVCLTNRDKTVAEIGDAILKLPAAEKTGELPSYSGGKPFQVFAAGQLEFLLREDRDGTFGCFVAFESQEGEQGNIAAAMISQLSGLTPRDARKSKRPAYEWAIEGYGKKSFVRLVPESDQGGALINLEMGKKK